MVTSAPLGTSFDSDASIGHILAPRSGEPGGQWARVRVTAHTAAVADGLSTAFCLMTTAESDATNKAGLYEVITTDLA